MEKGFRCDVKEHPELHVKTGVSVCVWVCISLRLSLSLCLFSLCLSVSLFLSAVFTFQVGVSGILAVFLNIAFQEFDKNSSGDGCSPRSKL